MRFPGIRLVEQIEQKFRPFETVETVLKKNKKEKTSDCNSRARFISRRLFP